MKALNVVSCFCTGMLLIFSFGCAIVQNVAVIKAQTDFQEGKYESALTRLSKGDGNANPKPAVAAQIGFLRGLCYDGLNQPGEARAAFQSVADQYPETDCGFMAKQMLNCEPVDLGHPVEESAALKGVDTVFNIPVRGSTAFVEAAGISGDGKVVIGHQILGPRFIFSSAPSTLNLFRWTKSDGTRPIGSILLPAGTSAISYNWIINQPLQISNDGSVVAGSLVDTNGPPVSASMDREHAFRWTEAGGLEDLGEKSEYPSTETRVISDDGSVLVGGYIKGTQTNSERGYFRWTPSRGFEDLSNLNAPGEILTALFCGVSDDGETLTGTVNYRGFPGTRVFRWTQSGGFQDLGTFGGRSALAVSASADGSSFVATTEMPDQAKHVIRWTQAGGAQDLGVLADRPVTATGAADDGSVVVGRVSVPKSNLPDSVPFRWTPATGLRYVCELGPDWRSYPVGVSRDGSKLLLNIYYLTSSNRPQWVYFKTFACDFSASN